jgi:hypothetical protein
LKMPEGEFAARRRSFWLRRRGTVALSESADYKGLGLSLSASQD